MLRVETKPKDSIGLAYLSTLGCFQGTMYVNMPSTKTFQQASINSLLELIRGVQKPPVGRFWDGVSPAPPTLLSGRALHGLFHNRIDV